MKILKTALFTCVITTSLLFGGCATTPENTSLPSTAPQPSDASSSAIPSLAGSRWHYMDEQWSYDMTFMANGVLSTTHPNDKTVGNDTWEQNGAEVKIYFNNKFSSYQGKIAGRNLMSGTATNKKNKSWNWKATRMD